MAQLPHLPLAHVVLRHVLLQGYSGAAAVPASDACYICTWSCLPAGAKEDTFDVWMKQESDTVQVTPLLRIRDDSRL